VSATALPVTLKMRLGWDAATINAPELARRAENAGIRMVTVHGRTRCQFYDGAADWAAIRSIKEAVSIPVIANGDLVSADNLEPMLRLSGADGVMIGRGAYGRPWLPGQLAAFAATGSMPQSPSGDALSAIVLAHYEAIIEQHGPALGVRTARKHLGWYMDRTASAADADGDGLRRAILTETDHRTVTRLLAARFGGAETQRAA
jgi:nifR3 family TIM-barrel protein